MKHNWTSPRIYFFYGWIILGLSTLGVLFSLPGQTNGVSAFTDQLLMSSALNRGNLSLAYLFGTLGSSFCLSSGGRLYDRIGPRLLGTFVSASLGLVLLLASTSSKLLPLLPVWPKEFPLLQFLCFVLIFFLLRFFGQGMLTLTSRNLLMQWFDKRRGFANAIMGVFVAFGFSLAPKLFHMLIEKWHWYGTWFILGLAELAFALLFYLFSRNTPRSLGQKPDGKLAKVPLTRQKTAKAEIQKAEQRAQKEWTLAEVQRTKVFWIFCASLTLQSLFVTAQTFHIASIFRAAGLQEARAFAIFFPAAICATIVNFTASWLSDRIRLRYLLGVQAFGLGLSAISQTFLGPTGFGSIAFWGIVLGNGLGGGLFNLLATLSWPKFFGTKHLGAISGRSMAFIVGGSALGPYLFSLSLSIAGTYDYVAYATIFLCAILVFLAYSKRK